MKIIIFEIKSGHKKGLQKWGNFLMGEGKEDALETLREEGATLEISSFFNVGERLFMVGVTDARHSPNMEREINKRHKDIFKKAKIRRLHMESDYHLSVTKA